MGSPASLVLDQADVQKVHDAKAIKDVLDVVRRLVASGLLGKRLFGAYLGNADGEQITQVIEEELDAFLKGQVDLSTMAAYKEKVEQRCSEKHLALTGKRELHFESQQVPLQVDVSSVDEVAHRHKRVNSSKKQQEP